jgi:hypothetical protein
MLGIIGNEFKLHAPFTVVGALTGIAIMARRSNSAATKHHTASHEETHYLPLREHIAGDG